MLYGDNNNWFAAWAFWILKYYGHRDVRLLMGYPKVRNYDGSWTEWGSLIGAPIDK